MPAIHAVWIEDGCVVCGACPMACPEVFSIPDASDTAVILLAARSDGLTDTNAMARSPMSASASLAWDEAITEAAEGCPVDVIRFVRG